MARKSRKNSGDCRFQGNPLMEDNLRRKGKVRPIRPVSYKMAVSRLRISLQLEQKARFIERVHLSSRCSRIMGSASVPFFRLSTNMRKPPAKNPAMMQKTQRIPAKIKMLRSV